MFMQSAFVDQIRVAGWRWFSLLALFMILVLGQAAEASGLPLVTVHVPQQQVDTDGDGDRDLFSADFVVNSDGTASGTINFNPHNKVTLKRGIIDWDGDNELAVLEGDHYRRFNGQWRLIGTAQVDGRPAGGDAGRRCGARGHLRADDASGAAGRLNLLEVGTAGKHSLPGRFGVLSV